MRENRDTYEARENFKVLLFIGFFAIWFTIMIVFNLSEKLRVGLGLQPHFLHWALSFFVLYFAGAIPCYVLAEISLKLELFIDGLKGGSQ